jgi:predicted transcriptional regulator
MKEQPHKSRVEAVEAEKWQLREIRTALAELDAGQGVSHEKVSKWLRSWGTPGETKAPRQNVRNNRDKAS